MPKRERNLFFDVRPIARGLVLPLSGNTSGTLRIIEAARLGRQQGAFVQIELGEKMSVHLACAGTKRRTKGEHVSANIPQAIIDSFDSPLLERILFFAGRRYDSDTNDRIFYLLTGCPLWGSCY